MLRKTKQTMMSVLAILLCISAMACGTVTESSNDEIALKMEGEEKTQVVIPAMSYYWAKEDSADIYYFSDKKLWKYD